MVLIVNFKLPSFSKRQDSCTRGLINVKRPAGGTTERLTSSPMAIPVLGDAQELRQEPTRY